VRVETYHAAIKKHVGEGDTVVDLGTGTGILAYFASQAGAKKVYALDHSPLIELAKKICAANRLPNVSFVNVHSSQFSPAEKVDVIIHEQIGHALLNEDMVKNICELRDRILAPDGIILPDKFELYLEPTRLREGWRVPYLWENDIHGIKFDAVRSWANVSADSVTQSRTTAPEAVEDLLCDPRSILSIDLSKMKPDDLPKKLVFRKVIARSGYMDGYCLYYDIRFDDEIAFSTSPFVERTHWPCHVFRTERIFLKEGAQLDIEFEMADVRDPNTWRVRHTLVG
jgi:protein arginine N-methyltransferase 1